jgi:nitrogen fixation NifU-like protein
MDDLYREIILEHYKNPHHFGSVKNHTHAQEGNNPFCGDRIRIECRIEKGKVKDAAFSGEGCAISKASASMLMDKILDQTVDYLQAFSKDDMVKMLGISLSPTRLKCALLPLEVLQKTINKK